MPVDGIRARTRVALSPVHVERFWNRVEKSPACWKWLGCDRGNGYGCLRVHGRLLSAHCIAFELAYGEIPEGKIVCHSCDNRWCVRPEHLFAGTFRDNVVDMVSKGRANHARGEKCGQSVLTDESVTQVWFLRALGWSNRRIARSLGVNPGTVDCVVLGKTWRHVSEQLGALR